MSELHKLESFHNEFMQLIYSEAESRDLMRSAVFFEKVCESLQATGDIGNDYILAEYQKIGMEVSGYDYDQERQYLYLLVNNFFQEDTIRTLTKDDIETKFKRLKKFFEKSVNGLYREMEEAYESYELAREIYEKFESQQIGKVIFIVITDGKATRNLQSLDSEKIDNVVLEYRVIDIEYLYKIYLSENETSSFNVDVNLPFLKISSSSNSYESYLTFLTGKQIVDIYENFGKKLFEQNVRTFLQFRGGVNKGLRNTIDTQPEMFFAYNNGLTATATNIITENNQIISIENLQIVNGAQTTSSIYAAYKTLTKNKQQLDLSKISVQMKLSVVIEKELKNEFVSKVSQYANTQNKISTSDFFSNSPFHQEFKKKSIRIYAPAVDGAQKRTHWFYERVRGEYLNEQAYKTPAEKKRFQIENPKYQSFEKTFLSKAENSWLMKPHIVARGAQYSFSEFAKYITIQLEKNENFVTDEYYKCAIAKVILFKEVERLISNANWYSGGYRAQTVTYTIAYFAHYIEKKLKVYLDFQKIWEEQKLPISIINAIEIISQAVYECITVPPEGFANISQWCKKEECWNTITKLEIPLSIQDDLLIDKEEKLIRSKNEKNDQKLVKGIEIQMFVINYSKDKWKKIYQYFERDAFQGIANKEREILYKYINGMIPLPSESQSKLLYMLYNKVVSDGYHL